jgi:GNAT superfamily N-acetyltransferase
MVLRRILPRLGGDSGSPPGVLLEAPILFPLGLTPEGERDSRAPLTILDLRHFSSESIRPVLEAENRVWAELLQWDYRASSTLLLRYLEARVLPGFVAIENGRVVGYTFCVYEDRKAVIGDVFALADSACGRTQTEIEATLLRHLLEMLKNSPGVERIESQLLLHRHALHAETFSEGGFSLYQRNFMDCALDAGPEDASARGARWVALLAARSLELRPWHENDFQPAGSLIAKSYEGHLDGTINDQYRSVSGSLRFLHNIIRFPGCGAFDAEASLVLVDRSGGALVGLILCSRVREDVQHVTQLCLATRARGFGLGALLLETAAERLAQRGFKTLSLTVTEGNTRAQALYRRVGFVERHIFDAMVWGGLRVESKQQDTLGAFLPVRRKSGPGPFGRDL